MNLCPTCPTCGYLAELDENGEIQCEECCERWTRWFFQKIGGREGAAIIVHQLKQDSKLGVNMENRPEPT